VNPYDVLGVGKDASEEEITEAFRQKAKRAHPDAGGRPADFHKLQKAALILRDPERRKRFDETGTIDDATKLDDPDQLAWELIAGKIWQLCEDDGFTLHSNLVGCVETWLRGEMGNINNALAKFERVKTKLENIIARTKRKAAAQGTGRLHPMMEIGLMNQNNHRIAEATKVRDRFKRALELLADYEFDAEQMQAIQFQTFADVFGNSTSATGFR
jgi:hypothetical protein